MYAREFHRTPIGSKVTACCGTADHVAKVLDKDTKRRKFLLRFNLASGDVRKVWRSAARCTRQPDTEPMGHVVVINRQRRYT